jgi:hypothetical protein
MFVILSDARALSETVRTSGHGQAPVSIVKQKKEQASLNQQALQKAEELAIQEALRQAILHVAFEPSLIASKLDSILPVLINDSASLISDEQTTSSNIQGQVASVDVVLQVDAQALRTFLQDNFGFGGEADTQDKFKVYVLSYTVEKSDPDRNQPKIVHQEVVDDQRGVSSASFATSLSSTSAHASAAALNANAASSNRGQVSESSNAAGQYGSVDQSTTGNASQNASLHAAASASANWENASSAALDASKQESASSSSKSANSGSSYQDTSRYYHMVVDYADPTKGSAGATNAVRARISGMLTNAGFDVHTLDISLMDQQFAGEDEIVHAALQKIRANPEVGPDDYVAIALNSFTSVNPSSHQHTAAVTYQIIRVKDGGALLPAEDIVGDSGPRPVSDDQGKNWALQAALLDVDARLPNEIRIAMQRMAQENKRQAIQAATFYEITVENASSPKSALSIESALNNAGFEVDRSFNGSSKTLSLKISLNGKTGKDVIRAIDQASDSFDFLEQNDGITRLKARN